jgi:peptidoglycan/xylan/chitin deacetylase (PgdA/CDA1 family)
LRCDEDDRSRRRERGSREDGESMTSWKAKLRDGAARVLFAATVTQPRRALGDKLSIATFHRCLPEAQRRAYPFPGLCVTPEELDWFLAFFAREFELVTLAAALRAWRPERRGRPLLAVTFDDAQRDNFAHARPVLERRGVRASFFAPVAAVETGAPLWHDRLGYAVARAAEQGRADLAGRLAELGVTSAAGSDSRALARAAVAAAKRAAPEARLGWLGSLERALGGPVRPDWDGLMSWDELALLVRSGHEVGSHSLSHALLTQIGDGELEREVRGSREALEKRLGIEVESFCYPNGDWDARAAAAVERAGYRQAVVTAFGPNAPGTSRFALRRCDCVAEHARDSRGELSIPRQAWRMSGLYPGLR